MSDFLSRIIERKKEEVRAAAKWVPEGSLRREAEKVNGRRAFSGRLAEPGPAGMNVIAEVKRASPSKGRIRDNVDPAEFARMYEEGGAAAVSVLTDRDSFGGSPEDLKIVRAATMLPALRKDFIITPYQVYESAAMGADAILLIVRALSPQLLRDLLSLCSDIGLDALVETHNEHEFEIASQAGARLIGINNRDLSTFDTDIATSIRVSGKAAPGQVLVAESGIHTRSDIERLLDVGIWNFLIGESLMRSEDPVMMLRALHGAEKGKEAR
ncbi:MAG: indole-3-glycerol phosphate synthase TrpC [Deltaproteobacteria bacterium]|jgi:indole-3-glycerol phosphate synthase|nr:indole-3-glycerol phosphate synthase TrpC [Deltaproteobacteria bacterium]MDA8305823.1 indole-3-glycerol phosphate synthase TrpC [Deltaproteobacteria bacterium]